MECRLDVEQTRSGRHTVSVRLPDGRSVLLHSRYDPEAEARALVDRYDLEGVTEVLVLGHGLGYHVAELRRRLPAARIEAVEAMPELVSLGRSLGIAPEVPILRPAEISSLVLMIRRASRGGHRVAIVEHPASGEINPTLRAELRHYVQEILNSFRINTYTWRGLGVRFNCNIAANLKRIARDPGVTHLEGLFAGRPAIMVASGPSLTRNVHLLREAAGRAVVIAAGSAYEALAHHGITPDIAVSIDPTDANLQHFRGRGSPEVALVYETRCTPEVVDEFAGPRFVCVHPSPVLDFAQAYLGARGDLQMGGTVATAAFSLARKLGCNPIISIGQDLALTGHRTHADGMACQESVPAGAHTLWVEGIGGEQLPTTPQLASFKFQMENLYAGAARAGIRVIDATEGGARKRHAEVMTLQAAIAEFCRTPCAVREPLAAAYRRHTPEQQDIRRFALAFRQRVAALERLQRRLLPATERIHRLQHLMQQYEDPNLLEQRPELARQARTLFDQVYADNHAIVARGKTARLVELAAFQIMHGPKPDNPTLEDKIARNGIWYLELLAVLNDLIPMFRESARALLPEGQRRRRTPVGV